MAIITKVTIKYIEDAINSTFIAPVALGNTIKGYADSNGSTLDTGKMLLGSLSTLDTFVAIASQSKGKTSANALVIASFELNRRQAIIDLNYDSNGVAQGQIQNSTIYALITDISALTAINNKNPKIVAAALATTFVVSVASLLSKPGDTSLADATLNIVKDIHDTYLTVADSLSDAVNTVSDFLDSSDLINDQYKDYLDNTTKPLDYSDWMYDDNTVINIDANSNKTIPGLQDIGIKKVNLDANIYNIVNGDTLSTLAKKYHTSIQDFITANPWLADRVSADLSYALIKPSDTLILPTNATLINLLDGTPPPNPTPPTPRDPLVLDIDKDGFISTVALKDSNTYFDITGDGIKEKVSWIGANDGILAYDKKVLHRVKIL